MRGWKKAPIKFHQCRASSLEEIMPQIWSFGMPALAPIPPGAPLQNGWTPQYNTYTDQDLITTLQQAFNIINTKIVGYAACNEAFKSIKNGIGQNFDDIWGDQSIYIYYDPDNSGDNFGAAIAKWKAITITHYALAMGMWTTAATLVHELGHIDGATDAGGSSSTDAESLLGPCLLGGIAIR
jgi:hypothetical protein